MRMASTSASVRTGVLDDGADVGLDAVGDAHALEGQHDVGEEDGGVDAQALHGHEGDLGGQLRGGGEGEDVVALPQLAVVGKGAAGLAHEPDGGGVDGLAAAGRQHSLGPGHGGYGGHAFPPAATG